MAKGKNNNSQNIIDNESQDIADSAENENPNNEPSLGIVNADYVTDVTWNDIPATRTPTTTEAALALASGAVHVVGSLLRNTGTGIEKIIDDSEYVRLRAKHSTSTPYHNNRTFSKYFKKGEEHNEITDEIQKKYPEEQDVRYSESIGRVVVREKSDARDKPGRSIKEIGDHEISYTMGLVESKKEAQRA